MTIGRTAHVAMSIALAALVLSGCGRMEPKSPSRAGKWNTPSHAAAASERDRDSDGIPDKADLMSPSPAPVSMHNELAAPAGGTVAAKAPPPPPPPPGQPQAPGEKKPEPAKDGPRADGTEAPHETSMLVYTAHLMMAVYQVDQGLTAIEKIARDNGGYLASKADKQIVIRIPRGRFDPVLAQIDKIGDVLHRDVQAEDVTDEYVDAEIRIKNARAMQARLKVLLEKASVKEALEIEKEMRRVTEELELLEGKLKLLKDKIAYSTITVSFEPRGSTIQTTKIKLPFPWLQQLGLPALLQLSEDR